MSWTTVTAALVAALATTQAAPAAKIPQPPGSGAPGAPAPAAPTQVPPTVDPKVMTAPLPETPAPPPDPSLPVIALDRTVNGSLGRGDRTDADGVYRDSYTFMGHRGDRIEVVMTGGFDTELTLVGPGVNVTNDDDSTAETPIRASRVAATLPQDGAYTVMAGAYSEATGRYRLTVTDQNAAAAARAAARARAAPHFERGGALLAQDNPRGAHRAYSEAIRIDPTFAEAFANRGVAQYQIGHFRFAAEDFGRAGRLNPNFPNVQANRQNAERAEEALQARRAASSGEWTNAILGVVTAAAEVYVASNGGTAPTYTAPTYTAPTYTPPAYSPPPPAAPAYNGGGRSDAHNPANDATACIAVQNETNRRVLANTCGYPIEAVWCIAETECGRSGNTWTIAANGRWPVQMGGTVRYAACRNPNSITAVWNTSPFEYRCPDRRQPG